MRRVVVSVLVLVIAALPAGAATASGHVQFVATFNPALGELPEGIAVDKRGSIFVSMGPLGQIREIRPDGSESVLATLAPPGPITITGLAVDAPGTVYAAVQSADPAVSGVWQVTRDGVVSRLPGSAAIVLPNGLAFDKVGNLYVTDTILGAVWRIPPGGSAELWSLDPLLAGDGSAPLPFPVGANGIAYRHGVVYVSNSELGRIVRIPVEHDGSAGTPTVLAEHPALISADGIALDVHGNIYVAVIFQSTIARLAPNGSGLTILATAADGLDFPSSLAFGTGRGDRQSLFFVNFAVGPLFGLPPGAGPGVLKLAAGVPGLPLP
jgi:sugar lactone lactonase YvrE